MMKRSGLRTESIKSNEYLIRGKHNDFGHSVSQTYFLIYKRGCFHPPNFYVHLFRLVTFVYLYGQNSH